MCASTCPGTATATALFGALHLDLTATGQQYQAADASAERSVDERSNGLGGAGRRRGPGSRRRATTDSSLWVPALMRRRTDCQTNS